MQIKLIQGGSLKNGGLITLSLCIPEYENSETKTLFGSRHQTTKLSFPTQFFFTRNPNYGKLILSIFGFGLCLEFHEKYED